MAAKSGIFDPTLTNIGALLDIKITNKIPKNYDNRTRNVFFGFFPYFLRNKMAAKFAIWDPNLTKMGTLLDMKIRKKYPKITAIEREMYFLDFFLFFAKQNGRQIRHLGSDFDQNRRTVKYENKAQNTRKLRQFVHKCDQYR